MKETKEQKLERLYKYLEHVESEIRSIWAGNPTTSLSTNPGLQAYVREGRRYKKQIKKLEQS